jgi:hypothetical protein
MNSYMAYYFLFYSNTDSSLAVRKVVEFALTLRASSVLYAGRTFTKGKKQDHFVMTNNVQYMKQTTIVLIFTYLQLFYSMKAH